MDYGLELTRNSKVGWAFSLARSETCIHATDACRKICYGNGVRYQTAGARQKRHRNYRTCQFLLEKGGPELLAQNLLALVDQARPLDWFVAQASGAEIELPWTIRLHDLGDHFSIGYAQAWLIVVRHRPQCRFWFYTRSFLEAELLAVLSELAGQLNCQGFLSIDNENFEQGLRAFAAYPGIWKLAFMQEEEVSAELVPAIQKLVSKGEIISFPHHRAGRHVKPLKVEPLTLCPQITTDLYPLQASPSVVKPCQACAFCLPG